MTDADGRYLRVSKFSKTAQQASKTASGKLLQNSARISSIDPPPAAAKANKLFRTTRCFFTVNFVLSVSVSGSNYHLRKLTDRPEFLAGI